MSLALLPMPLLVFDRTGAIIVTSMAAVSLLTPPPDGGKPRAFTFDGMDLWELLPTVLAPSTRHGRFRARMRLNTGETADTFFWTVSEWAGDRLISSIVFAGDIDDDADVGQHRSLASLAGDGSELLRTAVGLLESTLGVDAAYVAEVDPVRQRQARTLFASEHGIRQDDYGWELAGTPGGSVATHRVVLYEDGLAERFPHDGWLVERGFRSYAGAAVLDPLGRRIGVVAGLWRSPCADAPLARATLGLLAALVAPALWQRRSQADLVESEARYSSLFRHTHLPMLVIDPDSSQVVEANEAACAFYGYSADEFVTMSIFQVDTLPAAHVRKEMQHGLDGTRDYFQFKHRLADGTVRDVELYAGPIVMHGHRLLYAIVHDMSERRRAEDELERYRQNLEALVQQRTSDLLRANNEIQQATQARDVFFANMGHELRTPLYTVIGITDMLLSGLVGSLDDEQLKQLAMVNDAGRDLLELLSDVLDISMVQAGQSPCEPEPVDVAELAESTLFSMRGVAEAKGIETRFAGSGPVHIESDRYKLQQILMNLLSNAIKYTEHGEVTISVEGHDGSGARIAVADSGVGIPQDELPYIFEEFRQMDRGDSGTHQGTGLGLALCNRLVRVLGATIEVGSTPGEGSVFTLTLPAHCPAVEEQVERR